MKQLVRTILSPKEWQESLHIASQRRGSKACNESPLFTENGYTRAQLWKAKLCKIQEFKFDHIQG